MTPTLTISAKKLDNKVNYNFFNKEQEQPFIQKNVREVINKKSIVKKFPILTSSLGIGFIPQRTLAAPEIQPITEGILSPQVVLEWSFQMALATLGLAFGTAMIFTIVAGMVRYLGGERNRRKSKEWTTDIIKGFVQCLVAIPTIFALYYLATTLFGQLSISNETFLNLP